MKEYMNIALINNSLVKKNNPDCLMHFGKNNKNNINVKTIKYSPNFLFDFNIDNKIEINNKIKSQSSMIGIPNFDQIYINAIEDKVFVEQNIDLDYNENNKIKDITIKEMMTLPDDVYDYYKIDANDEIFQLECETPEELNNKYIKDNNSSNDNKGNDDKGDYDKGSEDKGNDGKDNNGKDNNGNRNEFQEPDNNSQRTFYELYNLVLKHHQNELFDKIYHNFKPYIKFLIKTLKNLEYNNREAKNIFLL